MNGMDHLCETRDGLHTVRLTLTLATEGGE